MLNSKQNQCTEILGYQANLGSQYGASLNVDYYLSKPWAIRSGLEYRIQKVNVNDVNRLYTDNFRIPLLINYNFYHNEKAKLNLITISGISFDLLSNNKNIGLATRSVGDVLTNLNNTTEVSHDGSIKAIKFNNYSRRYGITATKDLGTHGVFNLFAYVADGQKYAKAVTINYAERSV